MNARTLTRALLAAVAVQVLVVLGMLAKAALPVWTGAEIRVATLPVDPRSLFRGNYARLDYSFAQLEENALGDITPRVNELVYVSLAPGTDGLHRYAAIGLTPPEQGLFLRGRLAERDRVHFGIEAFFAPEKKALALEQDLRDGGIAVLRVTDSGAVALVDVVANPEAEQ